MADRVRLLLAQLHEDGDMHSAYSPIARLASYQEIVQLGVDALPELFEALKRGDTWFTFWLIHDIAHDGPQIPPEDRGVVNRLVVHFLAWGKEKGYAS